MLLPVQQLYPHLLQHQHNYRNQHLLVHYYEPLQYVGRFKTRRLIQEAELTSKQPGAHRYKVAEKSSNIADNHLNREFVTELANQV